MSPITKGILIGGSTVLVVAAIAFFSIFQSPRNMMRFGENAKQNLKGEFKTERNLGCQNHKGGEKGCGCGANKAGSCNSSCQKDNCSCGAKNETTQPQVN